MPRIKGIHSNLAAFLDVIAWAEGTSARGDDGYNVLFGNGTFFSYDKHPGKINTVGAMKSTAAGRYQLLYRYFDYYAKTLGLSDFSPESQDKIAIQQIREQGAIPEIHKGNIIVAIKLCSNIWASFPGAGYGQRERHIEDMIDRYYGYGGKCGE